MKGFIQLHRQIIEWEWFDDHNTFRLFMFLLLKANHKEKKYKGTIIKTGELVTGFSVLSKQTGLSVQQIRTSIKRLKSTNEITSESTSQGTRIQVVNYLKYQLPTSELTNHQQTTNKQSTTNNNVNNVNNVKKVNNTTQVSKFLVWFNEMKLQELGTKGRFASLKQTDINNLLKLKEAYKGDTKVFEHSFKAMCQNEWATSNNKVTPEHFLRNDNFQKYANTELKDNDRFKAAWQ